jgi:hypothetical protein
MRDLNYEPPLIPSDFGFNFAFGLSNSAPLDASIGIYTVNLVSYVYITADAVTGQKKRVKNRTPVEISQCEDHRF